MPHAYLTTAEFKLAAVCPPQLVDQLEQSQPGWVDRKLELHSAWLDARLRKRYAAPFTAPVPDMVKGWLAALVTVDCYFRRGVDPNDEQWQLVTEAAKAAKAEVLEAANSVQGLFDLPLRDGEGPTGITKGGPRHKTSHSPFAWKREQAYRGRME